MFRYIGLSSFVMNENLYSLLLNNVLLVLDNIAATVGAAAAPPLAIVVAVILAIMLVSLIASQQSRLSRFAVQRNFRHFFRNS